MLQINPLSSAEWKRVRQCLQCSFGTPSPPPALCAHQQQNASRERGQDQPLLLGMAPWRSRAALLLGISVCWRTLDGISIPTSLSGNSWAPSKQIFYWVWEVSVCNFIALPRALSILLSLSWLSQSARPLHHFCIQPLTPPWSLATSVER